ncbi:hypothetical protein [Cupriavidus sp. CP313]
MTKERPIIFSGSMVRVLTRARINLLSGPHRSVLLLQITISANGAH